MSIKDSLCLAILPAVAWACVLLGCNWFVAVFVGFVASFLPYSPSAFSKGKEAFLKEWHDPKYKNNK